MYFFFYKLAPVCSRLHLRLCVTAIQSKKQTNKLLNKIQKIRLNFKTMIVRSQVRDCRHQNDWQHYVGHLSPTVHVRRYWRSTFQGKRLEYHQPDDENIIDETIFIP